MHINLLLPDNSITKTETVDLKTGKVLEGKYPNYEAVIPENPNVVIIDNVDGLINRLSGVERAGKFLDGKGILARLEYGDMEVFVNAGIMKPVLQTLKHNGIKSFRLELADTPNRAIVIKDATGKNKAFGLVMPVMSGEIAHTNVFKGELAPETRQRKIDLTKKDIAFHETNPSFGEKYEKEQLDKAIKENNQNNIDSHTKEYEKEKSRPFSTGRRA